MDRENQIDELEYQLSQLPKSLGDIRESLRERVDALKGKSMTDLDQAEIDILLGKTPKGIIN